MDKLLTISVAAYNVEAYIQQTLKSLAIPEILEWLEVFVIDDGGTDGTLRTAKEFEEKYPQTFHAIHKKNGGYGSTVNWSIQHATGRFFKLLDGDDWFDRQGLINLVGYLETTCADMIVTDRRCFSSKGPIKNKTALPASLIGKTIPLDQIPDSCTLGMWYLTYRTAILKAHPFQLPEHMLYTDQLFAVYPLPFVNGVDFFSDVVYCYRVGRDGQSVSRESRIRHYQEILDVTMILLKYYQGSISASCINNRYILARIATYYAIAFKTIFLMPSRKKNYAIVRNLENKCRENAPKIFEYAARVSKFVQLIRYTGYLAYWPMTWLGIKNWS